MQFASFIERGVGIGMDSGTQALSGIGVMPMLSVEPSNAAPRSVYEPSNPLANEKGFVTYPGVDPATEMVTLVGAMRAYEANVAAMNTARALALKALEIGGK
jgi:flagellar basal-body rod protein FlgC